MSDGTVVAAGTEQGNLSLQDIRYFGPPLHETNLHYQLLPTPSKQLPQNSSHYLPPSYNKFNNAIQALAVGGEGLGERFIAFQLRGGCRIGLYDTLTHSAEVIHTPSDSVHGLTRSRYTLKLLFSSHTAFTTG